MLQRRPDDLTVRAELYADSERLVPRSGLRASRSAASGAPASRSGHHGRHGGWFPVDASNHAPDSVRAYMG